MSRVGRLSLSPDPSNGSIEAPLYKSGLVLHQQERNSPNFQSYKQHDYVNTDYILHTGSLASRGSPKQPQIPHKGLVSWRSAQFEAFLKGTLSSPKPAVNGNKSVPNLLSLTDVAKSSPFQLVHPKTSVSHNAPTSRTSPMPGFHNKSPHPAYQQSFQRDQQQQQQIYQNLTPPPMSSYQSKIENQVKLISHQNQQTYMSNMHIRVPSQDSSTYSDSRTYINVGQPVAIASKKGVLLNPSSTTPKIQPPKANLKANHIPAIPRSQVVKKVMEPSYSSLLQHQGEHSQAIYANYDFRSSDGSNTEEDAVLYTSPPSPVSSSYSELRVATRVPLGGHPLPPYMNPQAMVYDSLYEPIQNNPGGQQQQPQHKPNFGLGGPSSHYDDYFGPCSKCLEGIVGEGTGCSAMGRLYHIRCFTCHNCHCQLQGKPFYALDGKPFCEADYLNTLEKCCNCLKPILDRILRATGKPYHPTCFTCVVCGRSLDGVPFTVDATNAIHCIEDFHKRFAPRCSVCKNPIMPEPGREETVRVVALDRSFHVQCYKCEDCGLLLSSEAEGRGCYPLDDHVLCKGCNTRRIQLLTQGI